MMNSEKGIRIIGIDPGVATTGWAIVDFVREKISLVDFKVGALGVKLDCVAADLAAHRRDTEAHPALYKVTV